MKKLLFIALILTFNTVLARVDIWPSIPFIRGADLCRYSDAYGQTRREYMREMTSMATELMRYGAYGSEALEMLASFNALYDRNLAIATQAKYLDVTLETSLKAYIDQYYRQIRPREKKISFTHMNHIADIVTAINNNQRIGHLNNRALNELDYVAYGSYTLAPNCRGNIQVTLTLVGRDGTTKNYIGTGRAEIVMSQIASQIFEDFQRTQFPSVLNIGGKTMTLVGGLNGEVDETSSPRYAQRICESLGARLPDGFEYEIIDSYGSWSGGISISDSHRAWAMSDNRVFHPDLRNPTPVRSVSQVNDRVFKYICIK
jgi:hypothetical protein